METLNNSEELINDQIIELPSINNILNIFHQIPDDEIIVSLQNVLEQDLDEIAKEIVEKQSYVSIEGAPYTKEDLEKDTRGMLFEHIALRYLEIEGEPDNPELSNLILYITRHPKDYLIKLRNKTLHLYNAEARPSEKEELFQKHNNIKKDIEDMQISGEHPFNSDAIAIRTKGNENNIEVQVVGNIEAKNHNFMISEHRNEVLKQLVESKNSTLNILKIYSKYLPELCSDLDISRPPKKINVVGTKDFKQTIIQPDVYKKNDPDLKFLKSLGYVVETMSIKVEEIANIAKILQPEIERRMERLQKLGYKPE